MTSIPLPLPPPPVHPLWPWILSRIPVFEERPIKQPTEETTSDHEYIYIYIFFFLRRSQTSDRLIRETETIPPRREPTPIRRTLFIFIAAARSTEVRTVPSIDLARGHYAEK